MMKPLLAALAASLMITAAPAMAYNLSFDLPRLTFPTETTPDVGQGCSNPAVLGTLGCAPAE
jgi:hypothetical protein